MKKVLCVLVLLISGALSAHQPDEKVDNIDEQITRLNNTDLSVQLPRFIFSYTNTRIIVKFNNPENTKLLANNHVLNFIVNGSEQQVTFDDKGVGNFYYTFKGSNELQILLEDVSYTIQPEVISIWYIVSLLAIILLFLVYRVILSIKKSKESNVVVKHNTDVLIEDIHLIKSTLKVVRVAEEVESF